MSMTSVHGEFDPDEVQSWRRIDPPYWWAKANAYVIGDRHLPDGTRQHLTLGKQDSGRVVANAQVFGVEDCPVQKFFEE